MKFFETSKYYSLNRLKYINLRWVAIFGQFITITLVKFYFNFEFNYFYSNLVILIGALSNLYLIYFYKKNQISDRSGFIFLCIDIIQLSILIYLTGGIANTFSIFLILPSVFSSFYLGLRTSFMLITLTILSIILLTFFHEHLPSPVDQNFFVDYYYYYSIPISLIIALLFLNYFAISFGNESRLRKEALNKMEEILAKEHELVSLGGQAAAAAHSLGTPLSTIKIILQDLNEQFKNQTDIKKDLNLLSSQVDRCIEILKKLSLNPSIEDDFLDRDITIKDYLIQIVKSFEEISEKEFVLIFDQYTNEIKLPKLIEIVYGLRNFIGNANKFAKSKIFINLKSDSEKTQIKIEDDGPGFSKDIISKIGEPYINNISSSKNSKSGLGLGIFIGKTLLEKNLAKINCSNSKTRSGAEINIIWKNKDLISI